MIDYQECYYYCSIVVVVVGWNDDGSMIIVHHDPCHYRLLFLGYLNYCYY